MAKPASLPSWATDTNLASGTETGSSVKLEPSAGTKAQGFVPGLGFVGRWVNWWANLVYQWCQYLDTLPTESAFLNAAFNWTGTQNFRGTTRIDHASNELLYGDGAGATATRSRVIQINVMGGLSGSDAVPSIYARIPEAAGSGYLTFPIDAAPQEALFPLNLPSGSTITRVRAVVTPGVGTGNMDLILYRHTPNYVSPGSGTAATRTTLDTSSGTGAQLLDSGTISHSVTTSTQTFTVGVLNDNNTNNAYLAAIEVTFSDPGPRNF